MAPLDLKEELKKLGKATGEALIDDAKDILDDAAKSGPRAQELVEEVLKWKWKAISISDPENEARYQQEYQVAKDALATRLVDEKLVATTAAKEKFMKRLDAFTSAALKIGGKVVVMGINAATSGALAGIIDEDLVSDILAKI